MGFLSQFLGHQDADCRPGDDVVQPTRPMAVPAMQRTLLDRDLIVPTTRAVGDVKAAGPQHAETVPAAPIIMARHEDGRVAMLVFTDESALKAWCSKGCAWAAVRGPDLFALALETRVDHVVVNPAGPSCGTLDRRQIAALAEGFAGVQLDDHWSMEGLAHDPALEIRSTETEVETKLLNHLRSALADHQEIASGYLFEMATGGGTPHVGIGVEFGCPVSPAAVHDTIREIEVQLRDLMSAESGLDFLPLTTERLRNLAHEHGRQLYRSA